MGYYRTLSDDGAEKVLKGLSDSEKRKLLLKVIKNDYYRKERNKENNKIMREWRNK